MAIIRWTPRSLWDPFDEMDRMLEAYGDGRTQGIIPQIDVYQDKDNVYVETPLPGIKVEDVNISIENDVLTIEGTTKKETEVDEKNYFRKEVRTGSFHRAVALPAAVSGEKATAEYADGILKITVPKEERAKPRRIAVTTVKTPKS